MVKIPGFDEMKKIGADLMDKAKSSAVVDKLKSGIESVTSSVTVPKPEDIAKLSGLPQQTRETLQQLQVLCRQQEAMIKTLQGQIQELINQLPVEPVVVQQPPVVVKTPGEDLGKHEDDVSQ